jgi:hypothetical protein
MAIKDDLNRLIKPPLACNRLGEAETPDAIRTKTGLERKQAGNANDIRSEEVTVESSDGLFTFIVRVVKA